jgi:hypothetical protein
VKVQGAVINNENGEAFAVVRVQRDVVSSPDDAKRTIDSLAHLFPEMPIVLAAEESRGRMMYFGRSDISNVVASTNLDDIAWREYTVAG